MARRGQEEPGGASQEGPRGARRGQEERRSQDGPGGPRRLPLAPSGLVLGWFWGWLWDGSGEVLEYYCSGFRWHFVIGWSPGRQSHRSQEGLGRGPLAPADQRNFDETYASRFLYSDTDEILPDGSWVVGLSFLDISNHSWFIWMVCLDGMHTARIYTDMLFQRWPTPRQHA